MRVEQLSGGKSLLEGVQILWNHALTSDFPDRAFSARRNLPSFPIVQNLAGASGVFWRLFCWSKTIFAKSRRERFRFRRDLGWSSPLFCSCIYLLLGADYIAVAARGGFLCAAFFVRRLGFERDFTSRKAWIFVRSCFVAFFFRIRFIKAIRNQRNAAIGRGSRGLSSKRKAESADYRFSKLRRAGASFSLQGREQNSAGRKIFRLDPEDESGERERLFANKSSLSFRKFRRTRRKSGSLTGENCQSAETRIACQPLENFVEANYTIVKNSRIFI